MRDKSKSLIIEVDENLFYQVKELCVKKKITIKQYITQLIETDLNKS